MLYSRLKLGAIQSIAIYSWKGGITFNIKDANNGIEEINNRIESLLNKKRIRGIKSFT